MIKTSMKLFICSGKSACQIDFISTSAKKKVSLPQQEKRATAKSI